MCNAYTVRPKLAGRAQELLVSTEITKLPATLVRRTGRGVVAVIGTDGLTAKTMRWGIQTPRFDSINNARSDKLASPVWAESLEKRRCIDSQIQSLAHLLTSSEEKIQSCISLKKLEIRRIFHLQT